MVNKNKNKTIEKTVKATLCTGCGTCVASCPKGAIKLVIDLKSGIYVPKLDEDKCNNCGTCYKVCPGHSVNFKELNLAIFGQEPKDILLGNYLNCYIGHATDYDIRYNSASGGLVTALLIFALEEGVIDGALVTRMKKENPLEPEPFIARTKEDIIEASKSKYCPVPANIALKEILESEEGEKFAVVGLPCHLHGIRKAEQINKKLKEKIVLHIGIFCAKTITFLGTEFLLRQLNVIKKDVKKIDYRGEGWPGGMTLELKDGSKKFSFLFDYYDNNIKFGSLCHRRCLLCSDHTCELADISFGDAWLPKIIESDNKGTSLIITRKEERNSILRQMITQNKIEINKITSDRVVISQGGMSWKKRDLKARLTLSKLLGKNVPIYNQDLLKPKFKAYLNALQFHLQTFLASKRRLWKLLDLYLALIRYACYIKSRLKH